MEHLVGGLHYKKFLLLLQMKNGKDMYNFIDFKL